MNNFKDVESLLSGKEYPTVLQLMLKEEGVLAVDYRQDLNHAWYLVGEAYYGLEEFSSALTSFQESFNSDQYDYMALMAQANCCLLYTSPSPRDRTRSRMPSSA